MTFLNFMKGNKFIIFSIIFVFLLSMYLFMPVLDITFHEFWWIILLSLILFSVRPVMGLIDIIDYKITKYDKKFFIIFLLIFCFYILFYSVSTWSLIHSNKYYKLIGDVKVSEISETISPVDPSQIRLIDQRMARLLGEKKIGEDPSLGSVTELGEFTLQQVNGKLYWVAPLLHNGFFRWLGSESGSNGYIIVSATSTDDTNLVQSIDGQKIYNKFQPNSYFGQNLHRHLYLNGFATKGLDDFSYELNEEGFPFWVVSVYEHKIGFSGKDATGVVIVNPSNGDIKYYDISEVPAWIDRVQVESHIIDQISYYGSYAQGFWNAVLFKEVTLKPSNNRELRLVYGNDGKSYWYSGITSTGRDNSNIGFLLIDTITKETTRYNISGALEISAQSSAEGLAQLYGYRARSFIPYNIAGSMAYVGPMIDDGGLIKGVSIINYQNYSIGAFAPTLNEAFREYRSRLASRGNIELGVKTETIEIIGHVVRFNTDIRSGNSTYFFMLDNIDNTIFSGNSHISDQIILTNKGDKIKIQYTKMDSESETITIDSFENFSIKKED